MEMTDQELRILIATYEYSNITKSGRIGEADKIAKNIIRIEELTAELKRRSIPII